MTNRVLVLAAALNTLPLVTSLTTGHLGDNVDAYLDATKPMLQGTARRAQRDPTSTVAESQFGIGITPRQQEEGLKKLREFVTTVFTTSSCKERESCATDGAPAYEACKSGPVPNIVVVTVTVCRHGTVRKVGSGHKR